MSDKPIYRLPSDTALLDGTRPVVYVGSAILIVLLAIVAGYAVGFLAIWHNFPFFPVPEQNLSITKNFLYLTAYLFQFFLGIHSDKGAEYTAFVAELVDNHKYYLLHYRIWFIFLTQAGFGYFGFKIGFTPISLSIQTRGRKLLEGLESKKQVASIAQQEIKDNGGYISVPIGAKDTGFNPLNLQDPSEASNATFIADIRTRTHFLIFGGTRTGKSQFMLMVFSWLKLMMKYQSGLLPFTPTSEVPDQPLNYKAIILDVKGEYAQKVEPELCMYLSVQDKQSIKWNASKDLNTKYAIKAFVEGKIPVSDKDPFWGNAGRMIGAGQLIYIQKYIKNWQWSNWAYVLEQKPEVIKPIIEEAAPDAIQVINSAGQTLASVLGNLAAFCSDVFDLAEIYDGYEYNRFIAGMTAEQLQSQYGSLYLAQMLFPLQQYNADGFLVKKSENYGDFFLTLAFFNSNNAEKWNWQGLVKRYASLSTAERLEPYMQEASQLAEANGLDIEFGEFNGFLNLLGQIEQVAKVLDEYESKQKTSIVEWIRNPKPEKPVLILKSSNEFASLNNGMFRGLLTFLSSHIDSDTFPDDTAAKRNIWFLCDEFQFFGKMDKFIKSMLERGASKGVRVMLACQDISQLQDEGLYSENFVKFLMSNTGNIIVTGANAGETAEKLSNMIGKKWITKLHTSVTYQADGQSHSNNYQEHEGVVMTPDELSSKLGAKAGQLRYLFLGARYFDDAYILTNPITRYPIFRDNEAMAADWVRGIKPEIAGMKPIITSLIKPKNAPLRQEDIDARTAWDETEEDFDPSFEDELPDPPVAQMKNELLTQSIQQEEQKKIYQVVEEEQDIGGEAVLDMATEALHLSTAKHIIDAMQILEKRPTTNKKPLKNKEIT